MNNYKIRKLSSNLLKVIGAISMVIDHIGMIIFPNITLFRIIGRIAFPVFSFLIYEGSKHTKNRLKYFLKLFILGILTSIVYFIFTKEIYLNVLVTFSLSVALISLFKYSADSENMLIPLSIPIFVVLVYCICNFVEIDYGFWGIILPLLPYSVNFIKDNFYIELLAFSIGLFILSLIMGGFQMYSMLSILLLALYNGKKGFYLPRYFFYAFYPLHIAIIWIINMFI